MLNQLRTVLLVGLLSALVVGVGQAVAPGHFLLFLGLALAMNLGAYFFSDRMVLAAHRAEPLPEAAAPRLHAMVAELSTRAGIPRPRLYLVPDAQPNAFATGRNPEHGVVAVTEGLLELLSERELRGVLAHEIAHIKHRDILVSSLAAAMASVITSIAQALSFAALLGGGRSDDERDGDPGVLGTLVVTLVAPLAATLVQMAISRSREYLADEAAAELSGDPEALASALTRLSHGAAVVPPAVNQPATASLFIVNPLAGGTSLLQLFSTHPATAARVERLLAMAHERRGLRPLAAPRRGAPAW